MMNNESLVNIALPSASLDGVALINATQLAKLLGISERSLYRLKSTGQLPEPISLGGSVRWNLAQVRIWIDQGCPVPRSTNN
jgi:predicted DNA-binding transcriptional regulator AlpA